MAFRATGYSLSLLSFILNFRKEENKGQYGKGGNAAAK